MSKDRTDISMGSYADMINERKANYKEMRQTVDEILSKWDGGLLCVMRVDEDEKGNPTEVRTFIGGVSQVPASLALAETAIVTAETLMKPIKESATEDLAKERISDISVKELMKILKKELGKD